MTVWLLCCRFDGQTGSLFAPPPFLLLSLTKILCKGRIVKKEEAAATAACMRGWSGCRRERYTGTDWLTSGGLKLLTDTKETSTLAQPHAPSRM